MSFTNTDVRNFLGDISVDSKNEGIVDNFCNRAAEFLNSIENLTGIESVEVDGEEYSIKTSFRVFDAGMSGRLFVDGSLEIFNDYSRDSSILNISYAEDMTGTPFIVCNNGDSSLSDIKTKLENLKAGMRNEIEGSYEKDSISLLRVNSITEEILKGSDIRKTLSLKR